MTHTDDFSNAFIARVAGLLDEFHTGDRLTLSELSTRTGLPRSSTHRLLTQLAEHGWVSKRGKTYALGRTPLEWGALARNHDRLHRAAHPVLHDLHSATGLVVHLAVLEGGDVRYVDKVGRGPVALPSRIGGRQPAHRTALGKALLAHTRMHAAYPATGCTYATAPRLRICSPATRSHVSANATSRTSAGNRCRVSHAWRRRSETGRCAWERCP